MPHFATIIWLKKVKVCLTLLDNPVYKSRFSQLSLLVVSILPSLLTQAELAEKTGLSDNFIGLIERGVKHPTLETLNKIAEALQVQLSELFQPMTNGEKDTEGALKELKRLLNKKGFKDAKLLLAIYKSVCEHSHCK